MPEPGRGAAPRQRHKVKQSGKQQSQKKVGRARAAATTRAWHRLASRTRAFAAADARRDVFGGGRRGGRFDVVEPVEQSPHQLNIVGDERKRIEVADRAVAVALRQGSALGPAGQAQNQSLDAPGSVALQERVRC